MRKKKKDVFDYIYPYTKKYVKPIADFIRKNRFISIISLILIIYFSLFVTTIIKALFISFLIFLGGISKIYQRYTSMPLGVELVMFSTVLAGYLYGSLIGGLVGFASFLLATIFSNRYNAIYVFVSISIYVFAGALTPFFGSITLAGLIFSVIFVITLSFISLALLLSRPHRVLMFAFTSFLWNFWVFISLAPKVVNYLT
ncbi:NAD(P)(+) transhydrogenase (Re/Si-specific) subunit beta [Candidatus Woesearchaeota archaeon]|nr:NAD(P)(+) transhydrogenase (Re/Si-specific) subunit beta [Candidatus Woesearchaeota archaeon]